MGSNLLIIDTKMFWKLPTFGALHAVTLFFYRLLFLDRQKTSACLKINGLQF